MTMGGGTFTVMNKILPGSYINFVSMNKAVNAGSRGTASLPLSLSWGEEGKVIRIESTDFSKQALKVLGYDPTAKELLLIREAMKRAKTLLLYRVNVGGAKATSTIGELTVTAKYSGTRGNDLRIAVLDHPDGGYDVLTYLGNLLVDKQTAENGEGLTTNDYVVFGNQALSAAAATSLTGGTNGTADGAAYTAYLEALEVEEFNTVGYPGKEQSIKSLFTAFTKRLREEDGKKMSCVLYEQPADYEGIINVKNGVVLEDTTVLSGDQAVAWVTGATAAAEINESLTNTAYDGAVDVDIKYTKSQYEAAVKASEFVFYAERQRALVLTDINSLTSFTGNKSEDWASNRVIRVLDGWANDVARIFGNSYVGHMANQDTGRQLFKADLISLALQYQAQDAISNFDSADIEIAQGTGKRDVTVACALQPNDSMEKLYMTVSVV